MWERCMCARWTYIGVCMDVCMGRYGCLYRCVHRRVFGCVDRFVWVFKWVCMCVILVGVWVYQPLEADKNPSNR